MPNIIISILGADRLRRWTKILLIGIATAIMLGAAYMYLVRQRALANRLALGKELYAQHCAACHGAKLEGQPDWQTRNAAGRMPAPPHDDLGHTWHHSDAQLFKITKFGVSAVVPGYESDMLGFDGKMSDEEIRAVLGFIKSTWSARTREYQARRSELD